MRKEERSCEHVPDWTTLLPLQVTEDCVVFSVQCPLCGERGRTAILPDDIQWQTIGGPLDLEIDRVCAAVATLAGRDDVQ